VGCGRSNAGKSLFAAYVGAEISRFGYRAIISAVEDHPVRITRPRLHAMGANLDLVYIVPRDLHPKFPEDANRVTSRGRRPRGKAVVIDPAQHHLSRSIFNGQVRQALDPLINLAQDTDALERPADV
jgi:hypothetical protein